jgi:hypothetical protein
LRWAQVGNEKGENMKNNLLRLIIVLSFITVLVSCSDENGVGPGPDPQPPVAGLSGTYRTVDADLGSVRANITIESDGSGNISGEVEIAGAKACFDEGTFSSSNSASRFDSQSSTGTIEASDGSSKAVLFFSVSPNYGFLRIEGGRSKLLNAKGITCLVLDTLDLRREIEFELPER